MKRWILKPGVPNLDRLTLEEVPVPEPSHGEVRVRVRAVSLNYRDQLVLNESPGWGIGAEPLVPISDGAGEIDAIGDGVSGWNVGDRVTGLYYRGWVDGPPTPALRNGLGSAGDPGMLSEYVVLSADRVARIPERFDFDQAATLPCAALTAWSALNGAHPVGPGSKVLVTGTGGVALFTLLLARSAGAEVVATTSQETKAARLRDLGAADVINYRTTPNWGEVAFGRTGGLDKVVNAVGGNAVEQSIAAVGFGGEIAVMGLFTQGDAPTAWPYLMAKTASIRGTRVGSASQYEELVASLDASSVVPPVDRVFALEQAREAYQAQVSPDVFGKVVIRVAP